ncbi:MAG: DUF3261 domain-containing protein [Alphaproteobacteria bacterium]|nr:DUF3261 domain-containing protein [Alphaproteobacteria bacterium]
MRRRTILLGALALPLAGCLGAEPERPRATIAPGVRLVLPSPDALGRSLRAVQIVVARHGPESLALETHVEIGAGRFGVIGLDAAGRRLVSIEWDGQDLAARAERLPAELRPENLLADMMLVYFPITSLWIEADAGRPARLTETPGRRALVSEGRERIVLSYPATGERWNGKALVENRGFGYEVEIHSSLVQP